jgi:Transposase IS116/IS110/IS902 family
LLYERTTAFEHHLDFLHDCIPAKLTWGSYSSGRWQRLFFGLANFGSDERALRFSSSCVRGSRARPRQNSTGGKTRLGGITKRGNRYLRRLLINGASANLLRSKATKADPWVIGIRRRRPPLVVAVALANKTAGIAWAVMLRQREYQPRAMAA